MQHTILLLIVMGLLSVGFAGCGNDEESAPAAGEASSPTSDKIPVAGDVRPAAERSSDPAADDGPAPEQNVPSPAPDQASPGQASSGKTPVGEPQSEAPADEAATRPAPGAAGNAVAVNAEALLHYRFMLASVNGEPFTAGEWMPELEFLEGFRVASGFCNRFMGQGELEGGVLKVAQMASTKMLCADESLNRLEGRFASMMQEGAKVELDGNMLMLTRGGDALGWKLQDRVQ